MYNEVRAPSPWSLGRHAIVRSVPYDASVPHAARSRVRSSGTTSPLPEELMTSAKTGASFRPQSAVPAFRLVPCTT